ncbi:DUF6090 family protein [Gramella sp. GC03-9]|uniref:DUF6090 family protein n=1 Tax=Christiangramia oceanisediminis TaxID=2920386 RepID=A0A9X2I658_9FLAO|nr:DUF6090 family protein [Gramella oceanisediminis]MCP9198594.1 DUF6090 family protein [Gramella oceanisediminis]
MIKFFRNIRRRLLRENRFTRYLIYAVGEIILVVIGILIALQINNWNENRKADIRKHKLLENLHTEFRDNLTELDSVSREMDKLILSLEEVFDHFKPSQQTKSKTQLDSLLSKALYSPSWRPSEYLLNNLGNSGSIADLKNERLKLLLYKWSRLMNKLRDVDQSTGEKGDEIISYIKQNGSLRNVDVNNHNFRYRRSLLGMDNSNLFLDPEFENHIDDKLFMYQQTRNVLKELRLVLVQLIAETGKKEYD